MFLCCSLLCFDLLCLVMLWYLVLLCCITLSLLRFVVFCCVQFFVFHNPLVLLLEEFLKMIDQAMTFYKEGRATYFKKQAIMYKIHAVMENLYLEFNLSRCYPIH